MALNFVVIDFETFFTDDCDERGEPYRLKGRSAGKSTEAYIRHPWFQAHGAAVKWEPNIPARWYAERELRYILKEHDWSNTFLIAHHMNFDGLILSHHYSVVPKMYGCTLSMARLLLGNHISVSLDSVRQQFGLTLKKTPYDLFKGKRWNEITPEIQEQIGDGAADEVESIWVLFGRMMQTFPPSQLEVIDILVRMFTNPVLKGDGRFFGSLWEAEAKKKGLLLQQLGVTEAELQSADRFAELLREQGVEPGRKKGKNGDIYAFAKSDSFMEEILDDENEIVAALAEARLALKSTIQQTRAETFGWMASRGALPVYLRPYGAKTTRPSGGDGTNFLNMKKVDPDLPIDLTNVTIKEGICAPDGYLLAPIDSAQIECRLLNMVAGQWDVIEKFRNGEDPYVKVASQFYGYQVNKKDHPNERQVGKVIELQAGYGSGGEKIRATLRTKAKILISSEDGLKARDAYRDTHPFVVDLWKQGGRMLSRLAGGPPMQWGPVWVRDHRIWLPNGAPLIYDTIEYHRDPDNEDEYWRVKTRNGYEKYYGAKLVENLIQALAWCLVSDAMVRIYRLGYRTLNAPYDELLVLIPKDGKEQWHLDRCKAEMVREVSWLPGLPLDCEGSFGERYK